MPYTTLVKASMEIGFRDETSVPGAAKTRLNPSSKTNVIRPLSIVPSKSETPALSFRAVPSSDQELTGPWLSSPRYRYLVPSDGLQLDAVVHDGFDIRAAEARADIIVFSRCIRSALGSSARRAEREYQRGSQQHREHGFNSFHWYPPHLCPKPKPTDFPSMT